MQKSKIAFALCCLAACAPTAPVSQVEPEPAAPKAASAAEPVPASQPASAPVEAPKADAAERSFGAALSSEGDTVNVADVLRDPAPFLGKTIKTAGVVARVCEKAGCWLELKPEAGEGGLRVPMAGHAFFIPQDVVGRAAVVEGELHAQALSPSHREHLEGEGAKAVGPLALDAKGVLVR